MYDLEILAWIKDIYPIPWVDFVPRRYLLFRRHRQNIGRERVAPARESFEDKVSLTISYDITRTRIYSVVQYRREDGLRGGRF